MDNEILINQLDSAKRMIWQLEGYNEKVNTIKSKMNEVDTNETLMLLKISKYTILIAIIALIVAIYLAVNNYIGIPIAFVIFIGGLIVAYLYEKSKSAEKREAAKEYYQSNMSTLKQGEEYYLSLAKDLYYSWEFQNASALIPQDYFDSESVNYLLMVVRNKRADSLKEAINLYEGYLNQKRLEELQQQQLLATEENNRLQQEQLEYAKQQLAASNQQAEYSRQIAKNTRSTARAVKLNTFITILKK